MSTVSAAAIPLGVTVDPNTVFGLLLAFILLVGVSLLSMILYVARLPVYLWARRERGLDAFASSAEKTVAAIAAMLGAVALYELAGGAIQRT